MRFFAHTHTGSPLLFPPLLTNTFYLMEISIPVSASTFPAGDSLFAVECFYALVHATAAVAAAPIITLVRFFDGYFPRRVPLDSLVSGNSSGV